MVEDNIIRFANVLALDPKDLAFLREHPVELQNAIIESFDASGSKDGNVLGRLQSYTRHMAKRSSAVASSSTPSGTAPLPPSQEGSTGLEARYQRNTLLSHWQKVKKDNSAEPSQKMLSTVKLESGDATPSKASRSEPPKEAPPAPPTSNEAGTSPSKNLKALRPTALDEVDGGGTPREKGSLNADAPEFVPFVAQASPANKQPRTPVSLAKTIAGPEPGSPVRRTPLVQAGLSSPAAAQQPRTPVSLAATIAAPESPVQRSSSFLSAPPAQAAPPPTEAPALTRIKSAPAPVLPEAPSRDVAAPTSAGTQNPFDYHLHRLLFMVVAKRCLSGNEATDTTEPQGVLLSNVREEWHEVFGNDMSALMDKCGYSEVDTLVDAVDGLRIAGEGDERRVLTTRLAFEGGASAPGASAAEGAGQRRRPPPPPPAAPPVLTPTGAKVLSLDTFVQSPSGKARNDGPGAWGGGAAFPGTPSGSWGHGWDAMSWQTSYGGVAYPPPPGDAGLSISNDVPEPPSSSAL